ncbi:pyridoxal-phosphate dependent enzyme [bacterium]|nr:pyridoxal-phosphate dependent enzyme [candidate division CSSED10-310 bacterium]
MENDKPPRANGLNGDKLFDLLDSASPEMTDLSPEQENQQRVASDPARPLRERLEAYEDIFESEVGDTSLVRARNLEREIGVRQIFLKFEGTNPTGTQKDRIAFAQVLDALRRGYDAITLATCGNYGAAISFAAAIAGLRCLIFIPEQYHTKRIKEMLDCGAEIKRVGGDYEAAVDASSEYAQSAEMYDANPGGANTSLQLQAYAGIAGEIYDELRDAPAIVALPVSNGTTLAGIYKGFVSLQRRGRTSRVPHMAAGSSSFKNPIVQAWLKNLPRCEDLAPDKIRESKVNEPLINWHSMDGEYALQVLRQSKGMAANASDKKMLAYSRMLRDREGLHVLPASTAGLVALMELHARQPLASDRYVVILTGKR